MPTFRIGLLVCLNDAHSEVAVKSSGNLKCFLKYSVKGASSICRVKCWIDQRPEWFLKWLNRSFRKLISSICVAEFAHILASQHLVVFIVEKLILLDNHFADASKLSLIASVNCVTPGAYLCHSAMQQWVSQILENTEAYLCGRESSRYWAYAFVYWRSCYKTWQLFDTSTLDKVL